MKTKEYVKKFGLDKSNKFNHTHFIQDLTIDFTTLLETGKTSSGEYKLKGFENTVSAIRSKWDAISNKTVFGLPDKLWNYFFATVIVKTREVLFPTEMKARRDRAEQNKKMYEDRRRWEDEEYRQSRENFFNAYSMFSAIFQNMQKPVQSFETLGISSTSSKEDVKKSYRKLSMAHHPDKGGKADMFNKITEAKNSCLAYLENS